MGGKKCGVVSYSKGTHVYEVPCKGAKGNFVRIYHPSNYLTLCEVEVWGKKKASKPFKWVAMKKTWNFAWGGWKRIPGGLKRVSKGKFGTWGVNKHGHIYYRKGGMWARYPGNLHDISVGGNEVWGRNAKYHIYRKVGSGGWQHISGHLHQVSVSQKNHVWGIWKHKIYRRAKGKWIRIAGGLKMVDVGPSGVWGVNKHNHIYHRFGTYGDINSNGKKVGLSYNSP